MRDVKLHKVTWLMIAAGCLGVAAGLIQLAAFLRVSDELPPGMTMYGYSTRAEYLARWVLDFIFSAGFFATAAMVEFLARLLEEVKSLRSSRPE